MAKESIVSNRKNKFEKPASEGGGTDYSTANTNTGAADQRDGAIAGAVVATTNAGDFDAREAAKKALANSQR